MLKYSIEAQDANGIYVGVAEQTRRYSQALAVLESLTGEGVYRVRFGRTVKTEKAVAPQAPVSLCPVCREDHGRVKASRAFPNGRPKVIQACYDIFAQASESYQRGINACAAFDGMRFVIAKGTGNVRVETPTIRKSAA
jgi:hypothetical protein